MKSNGRIDLLHAPNSLTLMDKPVYTASYSEAMTGNWSPTPLSNAFFSTQNQQVLQNGIRAGVYQLSNKQYVISQQSNQNLLMIMRAMFLEHCQNRPSHLKEQVEELNRYVLEYCIPRIYGEAKGYITYLKDASTLVVPLSNPVHTSLDKTLELKPFF